MYAIWKQCIKCSDVSKLLNHYAQLTIHQIYTIVFLRKEGNVMLPNIIDNWLLIQHQNLANWTDVRYGKNCYWWGYFISEVLVAVSLVGVIYMLWQDGHAFTKYFFIGYFSMGCLVNLVRSWRRNLLLNASTPVNLNSSIQTRWSGVMLTIIIALIFVILPSWLGVILLFYFALVTSVRYFDACLPMPPHEKEKKRSEMFDGVPEGA